MEALKKHGWMVLVGIGVICLLVAAIMAITSITNPPQETTGDTASEVEAVDPSEVFDDNTTYEFPEI